MANVRKFIADRYRHRIIAQLQPEDLTTALSGGEVHKIIAAFHRPGGNEEAGELFVRAISDYVDEKALEFADEKIDSGRLTIAELNTILGE